MSEWWTYRPANLLMFSPETYYRLFELYNAAIWPAQILAVAAGLAILSMIVWRPAWAGRTVAALLAAGWAWVAWGYFATRYADINLAAPYFGWAFAAEALLLLLSGVLAGRLSFAAPSSWVKWAGIALFLFALVLQPMLGPFFGRAWSAIELFGLTPDPTVLATLGVLFAADRVRWELLPIPLAWCVVTGTTLWTMGSLDAFLLPAGGLLVLLLAGLGGRRRLSGLGRN